MGAATQFDDFMCLAHVPGQFIDSSAAMADSGNPESQGASSKIRRQFTSEWKTASSAVSGTSLTPPRASTAAVAADAASAAPVDYRSPAPVIRRWNDVSAGRNIEHDEHNRDSMAPSNAIAKAATSSFSIVSRSQCNAAFLRPWQFPRPDKGRVVAEYHGPGQHIGQ